MKQLIWSAGLVCAAVIITPILAHGHGFEGSRFFPPTIQTEDPFATDELSFSMQTFNVPPDDEDPKTRELTLSAEFSKEIFPKFALGIEGTYVNRQPDKNMVTGEDPPPAQSGFDNISISAKYQLWEDPTHEFILSIGGEADLGGTGSHPLGVESYTTYTPTIYFGKGFGDLPNALKYAKPLALTGTVGYAIPGSGSESIEWGFALEYSLPYLQEHVEDVDIPKPFANMIPIVEFSMETPTNRSGETTTGTINPGILWESKYCQIGAEAVIPLNSHSGPNVGAVVHVQIYIDDVFAKVFGHPIFGGDEK